ncbi:hypothetical protein LIER_42023 [Lithospermum erythrorhizon]|uniref:Uncharacterized protein n=1 Tax=Lithospermum erythrorhizon TaxID=34254 RepID=A0AAV3RK05_LITER
MNHDYKNNKAETENKEIQFTRCCDCVGRVPRIVVVGSGGEKRKAEEAGWSCTAVVEGDGGGERIQRQ